MGETSGARVIVDIYRCEAGGRYDVQKRVRLRAWVCFLGSPFLGIRYGVGR